MFGSAVSVEAPRPNMKEVTKTLLYLAVLLSDTDPTGSIHISAVRCFLIIVSGAE